MLGEKEKMKVMQSMENKLMKAIKEVNECELQSSTVSSPVNTLNTSITVTANVSSDIHSVTR